MKQREREDKDKDIDVDYDRYNMKKLHKNQEILKKI